MRLWDWSLSAYAQRGVAEASLTLQDAHGQNVAYLLWAVWAEGPEVETLRQGAQVARAWEETVLKPLRQARRALKPAFPPVDDLAREGLREDVKSAELRAERVLLETLEAFTADRRGGRSNLDSLKAAAAVWGSPAPDDALAVLAGALS